MAYPDGGKEYYHLLVGYLDDTDRGRDIADHPGLLRQLWQAWHGPGGQLSPHWITDLPADLEPHPFTGQQTHSSVTFGDSVQVKFFAGWRATPRSDCCAHWRVAVPVASPGCTARSRHSSPASEPPTWP